MLDLKNTVLSVCMICIALSLIEMLIPDSKSKKSVKTLCSLILLLSLILPFTNGSLSDLSYDFDEYNAVSPDMSLLNYIDEKSSVILQDEINRILILHNIKDSEIEIIINRIDAGSIDIKGTTIYLSNEDYEKREIIINEVKNQLGIDVLIERKD